MKRVLGTEAAIFRFVVRRVLRGSIILGVMAGFWNWLQGLAYVGSYATPAARADFAHLIASNPALGLMYGAPLNVDTPSGYIVYRTLAFFALISAIWGLLFVTRMLSGQEEDGRWEQLLSGQTTTRRMTLIVLAGAGVGLVIAFVICAGIIVALGQNAQFDYSWGHGIVYGLALVVAALPFMAVGALTSQLAATRRRAVLYGLVPLIGFFLMRGVGTVNGKLDWLLGYTPFGWIERLKPLAGPDLVWLLPIVFFIAAFAGLGVYLAGRRDLGASVIPESDISKPHFALVHGPIGLAVRLTGPVLAIWAVSCIGLMALMAALAKVVADSLAGSSTLTAALSSLSGDATAALSAQFAAFGMIFVGTILMVMAAGGLSAIRHDESRGYLNNFLVHPVSRVRWLAWRLGLIVAAAAIITLLSGTAAYLIMSSQGVDIEASKLIFGGLNVLGPIILLLGLGVLLYGLKPRLAVLAMYLAITWSFLVDMIGSVAKLDKFVTNSSLLHYVALVPAAEPDWKSFALITSAGLVLAVAGIYAFSRRDLVAE